MVANSMKIQLTKGEEKNVVLAILLKDGERPQVHDFFRFLSKSDQEYLSNFSKKNKLEGDFSYSLFLPSGRKIFVLGLREKTKFTSRKAILAARRVIGLARKDKIIKVEINLDDFMAKGMDLSEIAEVIAQNFEMANFEFVKYKSRPKDGWHFVDTVHIFSRERKSIIEPALKRGKVIGEEINMARGLSNTPGGDMTPSVLADAARAAGKRAKFRVKVLDEKAIKRLKMGGILGVASGSSEKPKFIIIEYLRGPKNQKPVVLVGKGVTFDTGGLNLKPEQSMNEMHMDMSGGAAVIHTISALARMGVKKNIVGLIPAVENMPSGSSYHPGDLLRTMSGKTIEVLNTDAEGRVILADALTYAKKYNPELIIDIATLTGAAMSALGQRASAIFTTNPKHEKQLRETGEKTGDFVWPLPLWEEYEEEVKGTFGDVANLGKTRYGGAITGAVFLWQFIKDPSTDSTSSPRTGLRQAPAWIHIDIAPRMTAIEGEFLSKGAAGASIALLTKFLREA
jgi:leucyl aminopeptidase